MSLTRDRAAPPRRIHQLSETPRDWRTIMRVRSPRDGYVRCETLMPVIGCQIAPIPEMPTRRAFCVLTDDGALALGVTAESAQLIADFLAAAASDMRKAS
jgi:hypothetical protein